VGTRVASFARGRDLTDHFSLISVAGSIYTDLDIAGDGRDVQPKGAFLSLI